MKSLQLTTSLFVVASLVGFLGTARAQTQEPSPAVGESQVDELDGMGNQGSPTGSIPPQAGTTTESLSRGQDAPGTQSDPVQRTNPDDEVVGKQPKRILWIIPNYRAVSANTQLPPLSFKGKLWLATEDTFDYSNFIFVGGLAGISMAQKSEPSFGQEPAGYGRYYWHIFVDGGIENYMTEAIVPAMARQDPRYYTLGRGGFLKRTGYAFTRLLITRTDRGKNTFNFSEFVGAGAAAGLGNLYYPPEANPWVKTYQRWGTQLALDGFFDVLKEFWPDINRIVFHGKY